MSIYCKIEYIYLCCLSFMYRIENINFIREFIAFRKPVRPHGWRRPGDYKQYLWSVHKKFTNEI